ncbi:MAG: hypothetical protein EAZ31_04600 [Cytophagia bacterium]|nr:MAG: hypothetical protein EAZ31_04600 [Cytophagia bacterium]
MKKIIYSIVLISALALGFSSCGSKGEDAQPQNPTPTTEIFVVGYEAGLHKYWKNGIANTLSTTSNPASLQQGIAVVSNDVYVTGSQIDGNNKYSAIYWKNGVATSLTNGTNNAYATSIAVVGTDVYVAGFENNASSIPQAKFWKNGTATQLSNIQSNANAIVIANGNVYVAGYELNASTSRYMAKYWTINSSGNITSQILNSSTTQDGVLYDIKVVGSDIYTAGYESNGQVEVAKFWKGTTATNVNTNTSSKVYSIAISNNEVYMAGEAYNTAGTKRVAKHWKATSQAVLGTDLTDGVNNAQANGIFVLGTDVYIAGLEYGTNRAAKYWKNGVATNLATGSNAYANAIFVR